MANAYSSLKIFHHKNSLDAIAQGERKAPFYIRIKPTNLCNHHCAYCTYGAGEPQNQTNNRDSVSFEDMIPWEKMNEIIEDMGSMGVKAVTLSGGGEPLTYPYIVDTVELLKRYNIDLSLITNGQLLNGKIADLFYNAKWVRISFDSPNEEEYMQLRKVSAKSFQQIISNIKMFAMRKDKDCVLGINFVISKYNYKRVYEAAQLLKSLGVNNIKFAAVIDNQPQYHLKIKDEVIRQIHLAEKLLVSDDFKIINNYENDWMDKQFKVQPFLKCYTCKLVTVIAADQKLYLCHTRAYDSEAILGDLHQDRFKDIWFSEDVTKKLDHLNPVTDCKNFCVYEERNKLIQAYFDVDYRHINFI